VAGPAGELEVAIRATRAAFPSNTTGNAALGQWHGWEWRAGTAEGAFEFDGTTLTIDAVSRALSIYRDDRAVWLLDGAAEPARYELVAASSAAAGAVGGGSLEAPMPGSVIDVRCEPGDDVAAGDVLVVLESMKMELAIQSPRDGTVAEVAVGVGDQIARGQTLIALEEEDR